MPSKNRFPFSPRSRRALFSLLLVGDIACSARDSSTSSASGLNSAVTGPTVPGSDPGEQSESISAVVKMADIKGNLIRHNVIVAFNDATGEPEQGYIQLDPTGRKVYPGTSQAGWSLSQDGGQTFKYMGKVRPPTGWKVLWGDPAIAVSRTNQSYVFISTLAVPDAKFPPIGYIDGGFVDPITNYSPLGGACILRSTDYGETFSVTAQDCLTDENDFYDGGSMVTDSDGAIYAAFVDVTKSAIHVWKADGPTSPFVRLPDPFAGKTGGTNGAGIMSHPRLRFDIVTKRVYVMAQGHQVDDVDFNPRLAGFTALGENRRDSFSSLYIDWFDGGSWRGPFTVADDSLLYPGVPIDESQTFGWVRTGPEFSFDVGDASVKGYDEIRIAYVKKKSNGDRGVQVLGCQRDVAGCIAPSEWSTMALPRSQWNPEIRTQLGFFGVPPVWKLAYSSTDGEAGMHMRSMQGALAVLGSVPATATRVFLPFALNEGRVVCPDNRGYWG